MAIADPAPRPHTVTVAGQAPRDVAASPPEGAPRADPRAARSPGWSSRTSARSGCCSSTRSGRVTRSRRSSCAEFTLDNFIELFSTDVYRVVTIRTVSMALLVTATCIVLAFPIAYYMARVASPRVRGILVVAVVDAAVGELPHQGLLLAPDPRPGRRPRLAARAARADAARASATSRSGSSSSICGCRT